MAERKKRASSLVILTAVSALFLAACGDDEPKSSTPDSSSAKAIDVGNGKVTPKNTGKIAFVTGGAKTFSYIKAQADGVKAAAKEAGLEVDEYYANYDPATELANIRQVMTSGKYGGVVYTPSGGPQACKVVQDAALKYNVLVVMEAATLCGENAPVGEDNWSPGTVQMVGGASLIPGYEGCLDSAYDLASGPQKVLLTLGTQTSPSSTGLQEAWKTFSADHPDWELADTIYTDFTSPTSFAAVQNALQSSKNKDVTLVYTLYVEIAAGAIKAVEAQKLQDKVVIMDTGGGSEQSVQSLESGAVLGSCPTYPFSIGEQGVKALADAFKGTQPAKYVGDDAQPTPIGMVTKDSLGSFKAQY